MYVIAFWIILTLQKHKQIQYRIILINNFLFLQTK